jgi:predicted metal-dependent peptidase
MLSIGKELTTEQRLSKAVVDIMANPKYVALAGILMIGDRTLDDKIPTACTDGRNELYGNEFIGSITDAELRFVILHENYHKLYRHLTTWKHLCDENVQLANMAMDYVINLKITDDNKDGFAVMPEMGLLDEKYRDMDTAQVFQLLKDNPPEDSGGDGEGDSGSGSGSSDGQQGNKSPQGFDQHDWAGASEMSADEQRELAKDIDEAIRQGAMIAGKMGSGGDRDLAELLEPQINWREVLREFITSTCAGNDYSTWQRPNRRYVSAGVYMPSGISEQVGELVIAIDTSGSIGQNELGHFLSEVKSICEVVKPDKVRLLYWDTEICQDEKYEMHEIDELVKSTKPKGGGGTMIECVPEHMTKEGIKPQACIVLTDGYLGGSWGKWSCPVLWCIIDNKSATADVGKTVHIKRREL